MKIRSQHIPFETLADMAEERLAGQEREAVQTHVSACKRCAAQLSRLDETINLMRTDAAEDAPAELLARAVNLFRLRPSESRPSLARRVLAALSFDSMQLAPAYGVRSGAAPSRQLLYNAGEHDLDLRVMTKEESCVVSGQVLGPACTGGEVELSDAAGQQAATVLNELCEFTLPPVPSGSYTLRVRFNEMEVEVPGLELRA